MTTMLSKVTISYLPLQLLDANPFSMKPPFIPLQTRKWASCQGESRRIDSTLPECWVLREEPNSYKNSIEIFFPGALCAKNQKIYEKIFAGEIKTDNFILRLQNDWHNWSHINQIMSGTFKINIPFSFRFYFLWIAVIMRITQPLEYICD